MINDYKSFIFQNNEKTNAVIIDAILPDLNKRQVLLQGFIFPHSCFPFPLNFVKDFSAEDMMEQAFEDGSNYVKSIEEWTGEKKEVPLSAFALDQYFLEFVREFCKSTKLAEDIDALLNK